MSNITVEVAFSSLVKAWGAAYGYRQIGVEYHDHHIIARVYIPWWKHLLFPRRIARFCAAVQPYLPPDVVLTIKPVRKISLQVPWP